MKKETPNISRSFFIVIVILISINATLAFSYPQQQVATNFRDVIVNATEFPAEEYFDYIVVGGGTAGCPLAATLSRAFRVLVLERGGVPYADSSAMSQDGLLASLASASDAADSAAQSFVSEDGVPNARGRVLGGSSAVNAGFYTRADEEFYSRSGVEWDRRLANESFAWVESKIVFRPELKAWQLAFRDGLLQAGVGPYNGFSLDHLVGTKVGGSIFDRFGRRHSAADLLFYSRPENIRVVVYASVEKILVSARIFDRGGAGNKAATGVVFRDKAGKCHNAMVAENGEVLLTAGALGSPQLLMLSGIGPPGYLSSWRIPVVHDLPNVGKFFYDNPRNSISILVPPIPLEHSLIQVVGISPSGAYIEASSNGVPFLIPVATRLGFVQGPSSPVYLTVATIMSKINGPLSVGTFRLVSADVGVSPAVRFNYFRHPVDIEKCVNGTRTIGAVLRSAGMERFKFGNEAGKRDFQFVGPALPADQSNYEAMADFCRRTVSSIWHYHGGCVVGKVVDADHRVVGIDSLRVVDGSTFPASPGTNPQATVMMLGRYVGVKITREKKK